MPPKNRYENSNPSRPDVHQEITNQIIDLLDQVNMDEYQPPFAGLAAQGLPANPITKNHYQGVNVLALWFNQQARKYSSNHWATFKQWKEQGAQVRKGEKGSRIIFYKTLLKAEEGNDKEVKIPMLRLYSVFNSNQVDGYEHHENDPIPDIDKVERINLIDQFCGNTCADIRTGENEAYYNKAGDYINMPETSMFLETEEISATEHYYSTLLHELIHWTGAKNRLDRHQIGDTKKEDYEFNTLSNASSASL